MAQDQTEALAAKLRADADDPDEVRKALDDAAGMSRNLWLAFISFGAYLAVAVGSVTHRDLFENAIRLPLLTVNLPLIAFFWVAPLLLLVFHVYLLLNLKLLADNIERYNELIGSARPTERKDEEGDQEGRFRLLLPNFALIQLAAGPAKTRSGPMGFLLRVMIWITVVIGPVALFVLIQLIFLPYHDAWITWWHRGLLLIDLALLWLFWPFVMLSPGRTNWITAGRLAGFALATAIVAFATFAGSFPGEWQNGIPVLTALLGDARVPNVLVIRDQQFADNLKLRNRDFRGAVITRSALRNADLTGANLRQANLSRSTLRNADLTGADLRQADLWGAQLQDAVLDGAKLQNAVLQEVHLEGTSLAGTHFEVANLQHAHFAGSNALQKDDGPHFEGADLTNADFRAADLRSGQFQAANLKETDFRGARLDNGSFWGATFVGTQLDAAHLMPVTLWHTTPVNISTCFVQSAQLYYDPVVFRIMGGAAPFSLVRQEARDKYLMDLIAAASSQLDDAGREKLNDRLGALLSTASEWTQKDRADSALTWRSGNQEKCEGTLPGKYVEIACSATANAYVSRGLIYNGALDDLNRSELAEVTKALLDTGECAAASKLTERDKEALNMLALSQ